MPDSRSCVWSFSAATKDEVEKLDFWVAPIAFVVRWQGS
eukprot:SAG22_NODE_584_length_8876_cov_42.811667_10_plen_39_part_00